MTFLECDDCGETLRSLDHELRGDAAIAREIADDAAAFAMRHAACTVRRWLPCGDAVVDRSPLEPFARWSTPVRGADDPALRAIALGRRAETDGPLDWRIVSETVAVADALAAAVANAGVDAGLGADSDAGSPRDPGADASSPRDTIAGDSPAPSPVAPVETGEAPRQAAYPDHPPGLLHPPALPSRPAQARVCSESGEAESDADAPPPAAAAS